MKNIYIEGPTHLGISIFKKIEFYFLVLAFLTCSNTMLLFYMTHEKASESYFDESKGTYTLYQTAYRVLNKILGCSDKGTNDFVAIRFATDIALVGQLFSKVSFPNIGHEDEITEDQLSVLENIQADFPALIINVVRASLYHCQAAKVSYFGDKASLMAESDEARASAVELAKKLGIQKPYKTVRWAETVITDSVASIDCVLRSKDLHKNAHQQS